MRRESEITEAIAQAWQELISAHRPAAPRNGDTADAARVASFNASVSTRGVYVRLRTEQGEIDVFLNAAVAAQMSDVMQKLGAAAGWLDDSGYIVLRSPVS